MTHHTFSGAEVLRDGTLSIRDISISGGEIAADHRNGIDLSGYYVLPGIIDLHGDAFEHHIAPRPSAPFPISFGLAGTDRDASANGITTAWLAQSWSWEGGARGPDFAQDLLAAHKDYRPQMRTDLRVQIRCETHTVDTQERLIRAIRTYSVDYVVFNNHLDEALMLAEKDPGQIAHWAARNGRSFDEHIQLVQATKDLQTQVPRYLCNLATAFDQLGVRYGSHDDADGPTREYYSMIGAKVCEFPIHRGAAALAKTCGDPVIMGAPNVVRGGSQSGNIAAADLIRDGLCDVLVSDYHYPTLAKSAFALVDAGLCSFAESWAMISSAPARVMGLADRGHLTPGLRADLTIINANTRQIEGTMAAGRWSHLVGALADRLTGQSNRLSMAAE